MLANIPPTVLFACLAVGGLVLFSDQIVNSFNTLFRKRNDDAVIWPLFPLEPTVE